jgi:hypothetical protein
VCALALAILLLCTLAVIIGSSYESEHKVAAVNDSGMYAESVLQSPHMTKLLSIPLDRSTT